MNYNFTILLSALQAADKPTFTNLHGGEVTIVEADDPDQLTTILNSRQIDLIVIDAATANATRRELFNEIPVLCITGDVAVNSLADLSRIDIVHFMIRPIRAEAIDKLVNHYKKIARQSALTAQLTAIADAAKMETEALAYSISHDLMAPVRAINGYSKILGDEIGENENPHVMQMLTRLQANSTKLGDMISGILELSRINSADLDMQQLQMREIVQHALNLNRQSSTNMDIEIVDLNPADGDAALIEKLWNILISNAIKFSSTVSGIKIVIGSTLSEKMVTYFVKDNGVGFDMQHSKRLFKAFQRLHSNNDFSGLGMGLALADKIMMRHSGQIWIESAIDEGTAVYFALPRNNS